MPDDPKDVAQDLLAQLFDASSDEEREEIAEALADAQLDDYVDEDDGPPVPGAAEKVEQYRREYIAQRLKHPE